MASPTPTFDPGILDRNLAALRQADPVLADALVSVQPRVPAVTVNTTRDGQLNLRIQAADGKQAWLGRTSIPLTRAEALVEQFEAAHANVLLPGIAQGTEVVLLLQRLARHRAVFVWEPDAVNILLTLTLHDVSAAIADGRLIFVHCPPGQLTDAMLAVLEQRPGHLCPERIMMWPWRAWAEVAACRTAVENAFREIERRRRVQLQAVQERMAALPRPTTPPDFPAIAMFSVQTNEVATAWSNAVNTAATAAGWQVARADLCVPGDVHGLARATRLADSLNRQPDFALLLDLYRADVSDALPSNTPAVSWLSQQANIADNVADRLGPHDKLLASDATLAQRLTENGVDTRRVVVQPLPCLLQDPDVERLAEFAERPFDLVVLAHLNPTDSSSYGHDLPTHTRVWATALEIMRPNLDRFHDGQIDAILDRAETQLRMRIENPGARREVADFLAGPVASAMILQDLVQIAVENKLNVSCWGVGWQPAEGLDIRGNLPGLRSRREIYRQAKCVLFASPAGQVSPDLLVAAEAGAAILWRVHPHDSQPGGVAKLLAANREYIPLRHHRELPTEARRLLKNPQEWQKIVQQAVQRCRTNHSPAAVLDVLRAVTTSFSPSEPA